MTQELMMTIWAIFLLVVVWGYILFSDPEKKK